MLDERKKVSIVIPVYNVQDYLKRCLESITGQTYKNLQIILIDDGSTDRSGELCRFFEQQDERILVIQQENQGLSQARNCGIKYAAGDYLMFVDSDDWLAAGVVENAVTIAERENADIVIGNLVKTDGKKEIRTQVPSKTILSRKEALYELACDRYIKNYACGKLYKKELFQEVYYPAGRKFEDIPTTYRLFEKAERIVWTPEIYYYYYQRKNSITQNVNLQGCIHRCLGHMERLEGVQSGDSGLIEELMIQYYYSYRYFRLQLWREKQSEIIENREDIENIQKFFVKRAELLKNNKKLLNMERLEIDCFRESNGNAWKVYFYEFLRKVEKVITRQ